MKNNNIFLFLFIYFFCVFEISAQFYEDFSSEDFSTNNWQGDLLRFKYSTSTAIPASMRPALQLNDTQANTSYICAPYNMSFTDSVEWNFWIKLSFTPTANNFARVYIVSDVLNITGNVNGYFVGIGELNKKVTLVKQTGATLQTLITSSIADLVASTNVVRVRVIRLQNGEWKLYTDVTGGNNYVLEGTAVDATFTNSQWLGLFCKYTSSNATKVYFDEFYAGAVQVDTIKPFVLNVDVPSQFQLNVTFSEPVLLSDALDINNYQILPAIGNPFEIIQDASNQKLFYLSLSTPLEENSIYTLHVQGIRDIAGNVMEPYQYTFAYYLSKTYDVVINEIMADPTPSVQLPEFEYLELYNRTSFPISLNGWTLYFGSTKKVFANVTIQPNQYLIVCGSQAVSALSQYGAVYDMGTISITNDGQTITLMDHLQKVIHTISFNLDWYDDSQKKDGGWSLEMIDVNNPCGGSENWRASLDLRGGTPGFKNSVAKSNPDFKSPRLLRATIVSSNKIKLWFSEPIDSLRLLNSSIYHFSHGLTLSEQPKPVWPSYSSVILTFNQNMQKTVIYTVTILDTVTDCVGNLLGIPSSVRFAISDTIKPNDIVINELLADPPVGLEEFVEVYNRSDKVLDLKDLRLANISASTGQIYTISSISVDGFLIFPSDFVVLTKDPEGIINYYYTPAPENFVKMKTFPTYANEKGAVILLDFNNQVIDRLDYEETMHYPLLASSKGVSLERIHPDRSTNDKSNWHSASETVGFATPAYRNSQYVDPQLIFDDNITIYPEIFSPDNDGYNDVVHIAYKFEKPGYTGNIVIYNSKGFIIRHLVSNELLGTEGIYSWDGITNDNQKAPIGIYVLYVEVFDLNGNKKVYKKPIVLGGYLNR